METSINERIASLINAMKLNKATFATSIKKTAPTIQTIVNGRSKPGFEVLEAILETYPTVNADWLMRGEGAMFRNESPESVAVATGGTDQGDDYLMQHLANLQEANKLLARTVEAQSAQITTLLGKSEVVLMAVFAPLFFAFWVQFQVQPISFIN